MPESTNMPRETMQTDCIFVACHTDGVPSFAAAELDRLYGNVFSSVHQLAQDDGLKNVCTYIEREGGNIIAIFLFRREKRWLSVINEGMTLGAEEISRFAYYIFRTFGEVRVISFRAIHPYPAIRRLPFPCQRFNCLEDFVLTLPGTAQEYLASLGKATRAYINRYLSKLRRGFPSFRFRIYLKDEVDDQLIHAIIRLNKARMAAKGKISGLDDRQTQRIIRLAKACGFVGVATIDGRVCGGSINYCIGANYFLETIAHDPAYDEYRLGTLCSYLTICECIARAGNEYHFLWGRYDYKYRLLGVQRNLVCLAVYRSRAHLVLCGDLAVKMAARGYLRAAKTWLTDRAARKDSVVPRLALKVLRRLRGCR